MNESPTCIVSKNRIQYTLKKRMEGFYDYYSTT